MKKRIISLSILLFSVFTGGTQTVSNPVQKVMYTLPAHTTVYESAFSVLGSPQGYKYLAITYDSVEKAYSLLFDGNVLEKTNIAAPNPYVFCFLNPDEGSGQILHYNRNKKGTIYIYDKEKYRAPYYVNNKGVVEGPFNDLSFIYTPQIEIYDPKYVSNRRSPYNRSFYSNGGYVFNYKEDRKWHLNINGKIVGSYRTKPNLRKITKEGEYIYAYKDSRKKQYLNIYGETFGPYRNIDYHSYRLLENDKFYAFTFEESRNKQSININGKIFGPYEWVSAGYSNSNNSSGGYIFCYREKGKKYVNANGEISGPYQDVQLIHMQIKGEHYTFNYIEDKNVYVNVNGTVHGPYPRTVIPSLNENGEYAFCFPKNDLTYVNLNGEILGPYQSAMVFPAAGGGYTIVYIDIVNGEWHEYTNGEIIKSAVEKDSKSFPLKIFSTDRKHYLQYNSHEKNITIDEKIVESNPTSMPWYDNEKNAFLWTSIEGNKLVLNEYKLQ